MMAASSAAAEAAAAVANVSGNGSMTASSFASRSDRCTVTDAAHRSSRRRRRMRIVQPRYRQLMVSVKTLQSPAPRHRGSIGGPGDRRAYTPGHGRAHPYLARRHTDPRTVLGLSGRGELSGRAAPHLRGPDL